MTQDTTMQLFDFKEVSPKKVRVWGALDFDVREDGLGVRRFPHWTRHQLPEGLDVMSRMPSGVRVQIQTDSPTVEIKLLTTSMRFGVGEVLKVPIQLQVENQIFSKHMTQGSRIQVNADAPRGFDIERGQAEVVRFSDLPNRNKLCEFWLPHNAFVELHSVAIEDGAKLLPLGKETRPRWVHYGSSISHCMEARLPAEIWPAVAARQAGVALTNFGVGGQCHLDPLVARTIRDLTCDLISIKVGINIINMNSMKERVFTPLLHGFLDTIREKQPYTHIVLISPIFCPSGEDRPGPTVPDEQGKFQTNPNRTSADGSLTLKRVRSILVDVVRQRIELGDLNLSYFSGLELFGEADRPDLPDDLHPNPDGYIRMGNRFYEQFLTRFFTTT